jgi:ATP-dependent Clp protease ATP-binding subunit ClpA
MLKPALVKEDMRVIGATTAAEYDRWIKSDPALERRFQPVIVNELTSEQAMDVLKARRSRLEHHHAVAIADDALSAAIVLTDKFVVDRAQPDKAIDVLDEACAHAQATAHLPPELEQIVKERRKVDAAIRRRLARGEPVDRPMDKGADVRTEGDDAFDSFTREIGPTLERIGAEIERFFGNMDRPGAPERKAETADRRPETEKATPASATEAPRETLVQRRDRLDQELRRGLEKLGVVVRGGDVARAVGAAVGKRIEWTG